MYATNYCLPGLSDDILWSRYQRDCRQWDSVSTTAHPPALEISLAVIKAAISSSRGSVTLLTGVILVLLITN
ncbi:hypothetical protein T4E_293 [Trichinella pseudospiralis]|uniref:Uncharacterized protein n=1 Tax=Trichinella pseudospiralis TaxID=6337 RepID=A0A0V0XK97_TRIPS|nr:hypothetical protein T4E_293 [Trichinella pseudospiralis]